LIAGLFALLFFAAIIFVLVRSREKLQHQREEERKQLAHQEQLTRHIVALQEKERARFAQDLHDSFGQQLTALKFQVDKIPEQEGLAYLIAHMHEEIRNVSFALSPKVLGREGLVQALKELSLRMNKTGQVNLTVQASGLDERMSLENETTLYRVCQEWINNILKYNHASTIALQFVQHPDELVLTIEDNGFGFDSSLLENSKGNGWKNIQSRVQLMKGTVEVDTRPGAEGNMFIVTVPVAINKINTTDLG
jgi:signal transduction histidine kinase